MSDTKHDAPEYHVDPFDRQLGQLYGLPGSQHTKATTIVHSNLVETATYIVQSYRVVDIDGVGERVMSQIMGDTIFLQRVDRDGATRIAIPPRVADAIARQRDALGAQRRRSIGKAQAPRLRQLAADRKAAGIAPAFLKARRKKTARRRR